MHQTPLVSRNRHIFVSPPLRKTPTIQIRLYIFAGRNRALVGDRMDCRLLPERVSLFLRVTCLRGVTWCAMAFREYSEPGRALVNQDTFRKLKAYMEPEFLAYILDTYVRKDFLA